MCQALTRKHLTSNAIKIIAIAAMTVDHSVWTIWPGYSRDILPIVLHLIGRITAPIMCYFISYLIQFLNSDFYKVLRREI